MTLYCIYDSLVGAVIEVGWRETMYSVVSDTYRGDFDRYKVMVWEG
jgi:hypothetical protein